MENERKQIACPKCRQENPADAQLCNACGAALRDTRVKVKINREAIVSFVCAVFTLVCFVPGLIALIDWRVLDPQSEGVQNIACVSIAAGGVAMLLGILALCRIGSSGGRQSGYGFAAIGTAIPPILIFVLAWFNVGGRWRATIPYRMVCGTNLSGLGKAMLIYSNDYDDNFPRAGGKSSLWASKIPNWQALNRYHAYGLKADGTGGQASISASLYLLVKYVEVTPKSFICKADWGIKEFKPSRYGAGSRDLIDLWDFGDEPWKHCSFSYHHPYGPHALTTACEPGMAVAADRNPWMASPFAKPRDFNKFQPRDNVIGTARAGNAVAHKYDGQNVLFLDGHVNFEMIPYCAVNEDNIYTSWDGQDIRRGIPPKLGSQPADRSDSLLVNDPPPPR